MKQNNYFHFVLHAHIPFVLKTEAEFWLYEACLNSYLPFINMLNRVTKKNTDFKITLNLSPILLLQLGTENFAENFNRYIDVRKKILSINLGDPQKDMARKYELKKLEQLIEESTCLNNLIEGFQYFQKIGVLNIVTTAFTHPLLPTLYPTPKLLNLQILIGKKISEYYFGKITGFWSPECAVFSDLSEILSEYGFKYFFADRSSVNDKNNEPICFHNNLYYFIRDLKANNKIWDADFGFPAHVEYQDFYADYADESYEISKILETNHYLKAGFSIRSITHRSVKEKKIYDPEKAKSQIHEDATSYAEYLEKIFTERKIKQNNSCISVFFDMELFGHWWKEGIDFLEIFIVKSFLQQSFKISIPDNKNIVSLESTIPALSTWGLHNNFDSWINNKTKHLWSTIIEQNNYIESLLEEVSWKQILHLLLSQASDWIFLVTYDSFVDLSHDIILSQEKRNTQVELLYEPIKKILL
ncbi:MAG: hypothetical protein ACRCV0_03755 [Brevinema sp.]